MNYQHASINNMWHW